MTLRLVLELGLEAQAEFSFTGSAVALSAGTRVSWRWGILIKGTCEPGLQCVMCASQEFSLGMLWGSVIRAWKVSSTG